MRCRVCPVSRTLGALGALGILELRTVLVKHHDLAGGATFYAVRHLSTVIEHVRTADAFLRKVKLGVSVNASVRVRVYKRAASYGPLGTDDDESAVTAVRAVGRGGERLTVAAPA